MTLYTNTTENLDVASAEILKEYKDASRELTTQILLVLQNLTTSLSYLHLNEYNKLYDDLVIARSLLLGIEVDISRNEYVGIKPCIDAIMCNICVLTDLTKSMHHIVANTKSLSTTKLLTVQINNCLSYLEKINRMILGIIQSANLAKQLKAN